MSVPFILSEANWILCVLLSLPGLYSVVKDANTVFKGFRSVSVTFTVFCVVNTIESEFILSPDCKSSFSFLRVASISIRLPSLAGCITTCPFSTVRYAS